MAFLAEQVPEDDRKGLEAILVGEADRLGALGEEVLGLAGHREAGEVALDVGAEDRNAGLREALGHDLQGHRLAGTGGAGDEPMPVGEGKLDIFRVAARTDEHLALFENRHSAAPRRFKADLWEISGPTAAPAMEGPTEGRKTVLFNSG